MSVILKQFDGGAISPRDDAILYNSIIQRNGIFNGCEITHLGANQLKITAGRGIIKGRTFEIEEMTVNCQLASYGTQKGRMYLRMELSNLETPIQIKTVAATSLPDLVQEEDCNYTNGVYEMELCTYNVTDVLISGIKMTYDAIDTAFPIARSLEEAEGVTDPDVLANALSVGQLSRDLQSLRPVLLGEVIGIKTQTVSDMSKYAWIRMEAYLYGDTQIYAGDTTLPLTTFKNMSMGVIVGGYGDYPYPAYIKYISDTEIEAQPLHENTSRMQVKIYGFG